MSQNLVLIIKKICPYRLMFVEQEIVYD
jgi:hypothetical protein